MNWKAPDSRSDSSHVFTEWKSLKNESCKMRREREGKGEEEGERERKGDRERENGKMKDNETLTNAI